MTDDSGKAVAAALEQLDRNSRWELARVHRLTFPCHHTQGVTRVGDRLFVSSVEVVDPPQRYADAARGHDRSPGAGVAHLFELDETGRLLRHLTLGEGTVYHPGGIDFDDERHLWVPVAEYRPDSRSIVYRVDVDTLNVTETFRFADHLGGIVRDRDSGWLHAVTWGSRRLVTLTTGGQLLHQTVNRSHLVDFQSCVCVHEGAMVCTGVTEYETAPGEIFQLGSAAAIDVETGFIRMEVPVTARTPHGRVATYNAVHLETDGEVLRMLVIDDGTDEEDGLLLTLQTGVR